MSADPTPEQQLSDRITQLILERASLVHQQQRKQVVVKSISDDEYASIVRAYKMSRDEMKSDDRETALVLRDLIWGRKGN